MRDFLREYWPYIPLVIAIVGLLAFCSPQQDCVAEKKAGGMSAARAYYACKASAGAF